MSYNWDTEDKGIKREKYTNGFFKNSSTYNSYLFLGNGQTKL